MLPEKKQELSEKIFLASSVLTGNGAQHIRDEDLHQSLVEDVVAAPHPQSDWFIFTQSHQLLSGNRTFHVIIAAHTQKNRP